MNVSVLLLHTDTFPPVGVMDETTVGFAGVGSTVAVTAVLVLSQAIIRLT